jgi:aspartate 1-decarboxylase
MNAANLIENEVVQVLNINNGERFETYVIKGAKDTGIICLNGPAARLVQVDDIVIVVSYAAMDFEEAKIFKPTIIFPDRNNRIVNN